MSVVSTQIDLAAVYFVAGLSLELRKDHSTNPAMLIRYTYYEVRVGMTDESTNDTPRMLTLNPVRVHQHCRYKSHCSLATLGVKHQARRRSSGI